MTVYLYHYLNKRVFYNLLPKLEPMQIELPLITPLMDLISSETEKHHVTCSCCGWQGSEMKARKHYLAVSNIAELELFCPTCNQYLGFLAEPTQTQS